MDRICAVVVNPAAGGGRAGRLLPATQAALDGAGVRHEVHTSTSLAHARELATAAAGRGHVVAAFGGDGLAGALAGTVSAAGGTFTLLPAGRGNDLARTLGVPDSPEQAARRLATAPERAIDLIAVGTGPPGGAEQFVAGSVYLGIPATAAATATGARFPPGTLAYPAAALRALATWRPTTFRLTLDGTSEQEFTGGALVVANSRFFGAGMMVAPRADPADGLLDVVWIRGRSRTAMLRALGKLKDGSHLGLPPVGTARAHLVTVSAGRDVLAGADGETLACADPLRAGTLLRVRALPGALRFLG